MGDPGGWGRTHEGLKGRDGEAAEGTHWDVAVIR